MDEKLRPDLVASKVLNTAVEGIADVADYLKTDPVPAVFRELKRYDRTKFRADLIAGSTVALMTIPQAIGFALVAGLPVESVLACAILGGFFCALFTTSRQLVFGPTNTISIIIAGLLAGLPESELTSLQKVLVFGCLVGFIQIGAGVLKLGGLTQYVSRTVVIAYGAGVAVLIASGQIGNLLGIGQPEKVDLLNIARHLADSLVHLDVHAPTALIGASSLLVLLIIRRLRPHWPEGLFVMVAAGTAAYFLPLGEMGVRLVRDSGAVSGSMPIFTGFPLSGEGALLVPQVFSAALAAAILGMLEVISITTTLATRSGQRVDPNRELIAMGAGNLGAITFGAMPGSASFVRSALNFQSGGRTQLAAAYSSGLLLLIVLAVARFANLIPTAALAAMLMLVAWRLVDWDRISIVRRATRSDAVVFWVTFLSTLFLDLDTAIFAGVGISLASFLRKAAAPVLQEYRFNETGHLTELSNPEERPHDEISIIHVEGELFFGAADLFQQQVRILAEDQDIRVFVLRLKNARHLDATTVMALLELSSSLRTSGRYLLVSGVTEDVERVLRSSGAWDRLGADNIFVAEANPNVSTKRALERAQQLLQKKSAGVRIFYDRPQKTTG